MFITQIFITNTVPTIATYLQDKEPFEVLSMARLYSLLDDRLNRQYTTTAIEMDS